MLPCAHVPAHRPTFGCVIDGQADERAQSEMYASLFGDGPVSGPWTFRQFVVLTHDGAPDPATVADLRRRAGLAP